MRTRTARIFTLGILALLCVAAHAPARATDLAHSEFPANSVQSGPPDCGGDRSTTARLLCARDAIGLATGNYGGTDFFVTCEQPTTTFCSTNEAWLYIMEGMAPTGPPVRCALSGESRTVNAPCGALRLLVY